MASNVGGGGIETIIPLGSLSYLKDHHGALGPRRGKHFDPQVIDPFAYYTRNASHENAVAGGRDCKV